jgi:transcriptional regulator with XRE-family HTH domain
VRAQPSVDPTDHDDGATLVTLGLRIRHRRRALGMTLRDVSARSGMSVPFLSQVENGVGTPSLTTLFAIARVLGTPPESLLAGPSSDDVALVRADDGARYFVTDAHRSAERRQIHGRRRSVHRGRVPRRARCRSRRVLLVGRSRDAARARRSPRGRPAPR